jgi:hypothetical protein
VPDDIRERLTNNVTNRPSFSLGVIIAIPHMWNVKDIIHVIN